MIAAAKGAAVRSVMPRDRQTRYLLTSGVTVVWYPEYGRYACLTCRVNDCEHTRAVLEYEHSTTESHD